MSDDRVSISSSSNHQKSSLGSGSMSMGGGSMGPDKVPYIKGEKTILCWSCNSVLMVKDEWSIIQCTNCQKINRIPGTEKKEPIKINDNVNHFDLYLPYVYIVISCPFCKTDNKCRKDAEHVICYKCKNSVSILQENKSNVLSQSLPQSQFNYPPPKSMRISDMYFPDPMFYPGFYPSGMMNPYDPYQRMGMGNNGPDPRADMSQMFDKMARIDRSKKFIHNDFDKYERNRLHQLPRESKPRFNALSEFVNTVHNIHSNSRSSYGSGKNSSYQNLNNRY